MLPGERRTGERPLDVAADAARGPLVSPLPASSNGGPVTWLNAARGLAILLVISHHTIWFALAVGAADQRWVLADAVFNTFRMPMFFAVSGVLASSALHRSWSTLLRGRLMLLVWVYVVWTVIVELIEPSLPPGEASVPGIGKVAWRVLVGDSDAWYLYALVVFMLVAKFTLRVPTIVSVGLLTLMSLVFGSDILKPDNLAWHSMGMYAVFFFAGSRLRGRVFALPRAGVPWWVAGVALAVFGVAAGASFLAFGSEALSVFGVKFVLSLIALVAGYFAAVWVSGVPVGWPVTKIGELTLSFYVTHTLVARAALLLFLTFVIEEDTTGRAVQVGFPLVLIITTLVAVALVRVPLSRVPGLFAPPVQLTRVLNRGAVSMPRNAG
jgi:uncharacterized membrane protein YcfT